jgi:hypothetical protein
MGTIPPSAGAKLGGVLAGTGGNAIGGLISIGAVYIPMAIPVMATSTGALAANQVHLAPIIFPVACTVTHIVFEATASTPNARVGLYECTASTVSLLSESTSTAVSGAAVQEVALAASQSVVTGKTYFLALCLDGSCTVRVPSTTIAVPDFPTMFWAGNRTGWGYHYDAHTYGALPDPPSLTAAYGSDFPIMMAKVTA